MKTLKGGGQYLQSLIKKYDGNVAKALAAYNAGPGRVDKGATAAGDAGLCG